MKLSQFRWLAALGGWLLLSGAALAQAYPIKPVTLIVPWPAGGPTDIVLRSIADAAAKHLGQPIIIDNKGGGGGTVARPRWPRRQSRTAIRSAQMPDHGISPAADAEDVMDGG